MSLVKLVTLRSRKKCNDCGKIIYKGKKAVRMVDSEYPHFVEYYHHTEKCCEETFENYKSITSKEQEMDLI